MIGIDSPRRRWRIDLGCPFVAFALFAASLSHADPPGRRAHPPAATASQTLTESHKSRLQNELRSRSPDQRLVILRELAHYRDVDAVRLIVQFGLRDRDPRLQDAAATALAASRGDSACESYLIELLRQELRSPKRPFADFVGRLAAAVGDRRSTTAFAELTRGAGGADTAVQEICLDALLAALDRAARDRDPVVVPALEALSEAPLFANSAGVRKCLSDTLRQIEQPAAVALLIHNLDRIDGELRWDVIQHLSRVTGQTHGADAAAWNRWWQTHGAEFQWSASATAASNETLPQQGSPLYYYDLPVRAQRIVFVLDVSKSMGLGGTVSRLAAAQRELARAIEQLPDQTLFNVIVFQATVSKWQERLHPATPASKTHACAFVRSQRPLGKTATYDALQAAFAMTPEPEAIYLLSDGVPSAGGVIPPDRVLDAIRRQNHRHRIKIYTLGTLAGPQDAALADFLERLAAQNYGQFRRLD